MLKKDFLGFLIKGLASRLLFYMTELLGTFKKKKNSISIIISFILFHLYSQDGC